MKRLSISFFAAHILFIMLIAMIWTDGNRETDSAIPLTAAICIFEFIYLAVMWKNNFRKPREKNKRIKCSRCGFDGEVETDPATLRREKMLRSRPVRADLMIILWGALIIWEVLSVKLGVSHPILTPPPENVFYVFAREWKYLIKCILSSMELLAVGISLGIFLGTILGLLAGWIPLAKEIFFPIAQVVAPIPPIVYAPYLVAVMPTFRSASALIVLLGIFFPTFLNMILKVDAIDRKIIDSARCLEVNNRTMVIKILFPYILPGIISGLKVTFTTAMMLLIFAEMMGATSGLGYFIINYAHYGNYTNVIAGIILVATVITIITVIIEKIQKYAIKWN